MYHGIMDVDDGFVDFDGFIMVLYGIVWMYHGFIMEIA